MPHVLALPTPFPVGPVNVYLFEGDELTLVDTGTQTSRTMESLRQQLATRGFQVCDIRRIIVTHTHLDHCGLTAQIVAESGARVFTHRNNAEWLTEFPQTWAADAPFLDRLALQNGIPSALRDALSGLGNNLARYCQAVPVAGVLEEGDQLALNGATWRVLHTPGHSGGLVCLYQPEQQCLLSSDHLLKTISSNPFVELSTNGNRERRRSLVEYLASLRRIAELPVRLILPGHGEPITDDHRALIAQRLQSYQARADQIAQILVGGAQTAYQLIGAVFPNLKPADTLLAFSEVIGHLDLLGEQGRVIPQSRGELIYYRLN
ncbi:MAG: MBL fold metallo-hydrolase [Chloroflexi bacterium]|nr:MBL fold metallo-hydrolase [Chloroflexota bacterium]